jgi:hypothetical protein
MAQPPTTKANQWLVMCSLKFYLRNYAWSRWTHAVNKTATGYSPTLWATSKSDDMRRMTVIFLRSLLFFVLLDSCNPSERFDYVAVQFETGEIYIKKLSWGIMGDAQKTAISLSRWNSFDNHESDYTYDGMTELFYKTSRDTLLLFVRDQFAKPTQWSSDIIVRQIVLENPQFMELFDEERDCKDKNCIEGF